MFFVFDFSTTGRWKRHGTAPFLPITVGGGIARLAALPLPPCIALVLSLHSVYEEFALSLLAPPSFPALRSHLCAPLLSSPPHLLPAAAGDKAARGGRKTR